MRRRTRNLGTPALAVAICAAASAVAPALADARVTVTFTPTSAEQTFSVPPGVRSVHVVAVGAKGGDTSGPTVGGSGAVASGDLGVLPGEMLFVEVGTNGAGYPGGGFNGGGNGGFNSPYPGAGGGGASDVRSIAAAQGGSLSSRILVAAGGGGAGGPGNATDHGGERSQSGGPGDGQNGGGGPGTPAKGGAGGTAPTNASMPPSSNTGSPGAFGLGGEGGGDQVTGWTTGGGGGGGGGGYYGGGGGGSSFAAARVSHFFVHTDTTSSPLLSVTYTPAPSIEASPQVVLFGGQPKGKSSKSKRLTLTNAGSAALRVSSVKLRGPDRRDYSVDSGCVTPLAPRQRCVLFIRFTPRKTGTRAALVHIASNSPSGPTDVALIGTGKRHKRKH